MEPLHDACALIASGDPAGWKMAHNLASPHTLIASADLLDAHVLHKHHAKRAQREYYTVQGAKKKQHVVVNHFCTCSAYCHHVASQPQQALVCKHSLAVMLAEALGRVELVERDDDVWAAEFASAWQAALFEE